MFSKLNDLFWGVTWNVTVFNLKLGKRALREFEYRCDRLQRTLSPTVEAPASKPGQCGFESHRVYKASDPREKTGTSGTEPFLPHLFPFIGEGLCWEARPTNCPGPVVRPGITSRAASAGQR